jgi:hypothetical protein
VKLGHIGYDATHIRLLGGIVSRSSSGTHSRLGEPRPTQDWALADLLELRRISRRPGRDAAIAALLVRCQAGRPLDESETAACLTAVRCPKPTSHANTDGGQALIDAALLTLNLAPAAEVARALVPWLRAPADVTDSAGFWVRCRILWHLTRSPAPALRSDEVEAIVEWFQSVPGAVLYPVLGLSMRGFLLAHRELYSKARLRVWLGNARHRNHRWVFEELGNPKTKLPKTKTALRQRAKSMCGENGQWRPLPLT